MKGVTFLNTVCVLALFFFVFCEVNIWNLTVTMDVAE